MGGEVPPASQVDLPKRLRRQWADARQHADAALDAFRESGDRPAEARALREVGLLLRDQPAQADALRRFVATPQVTRAAGRRIAMMRGLVLDYAAQHQLVDAGTGLVDIGWTGRMAGSFIELCETAGMSRPSVVFWGHEPRATGWTDPAAVAAYMYNTATGQGLHWRVPNVPFIMETARARATGT